MRERSGRQDVPERSGPNGLARRASAANATNESGGEAEDRRRSRGVAVRPRRGVYGALVGRLTAERRAASLQRTVGKIALSWFYSGCRWDAEKSLEIQA